MHWWHKAAEYTRAGILRQFGLITTNSITQTYNRRVLEHHLSAAPPLSLIFAIPDHPWVDTVDGAAVRIAMSVARDGTVSGVLQEVVDEKPLGVDEVQVQLRQRMGVIQADLSIGADVASTKPLSCSEGLHSNGMMLRGAGFILTGEEATALGLGLLPDAARHIRPYLNGRDVAQVRRGAYIIDFYGLTADEARRVLPAAYQWVLERVKPERDASRDRLFHENWWLFGRTRPMLRAAIRVYADTS